MKLRCFFILLMTLCNAIIYAATGDSIIVTSHNRVLIQTNPNIGHTEYSSWVVFPDNTVKYNKVVLKLRFECPSDLNLNCGEWDYLNWIYLKRQGSANNPDLNMSLATFITPYGFYFPDNWMHEWAIDVTDFSPLLRDSVEIEYRHTGYEAQNDRGWRITLDFVIVEGEPSREVLKVEPVYNGSYGYGNTTDPISNFLTEKSFSPVAGADALRFRITQTGHGFGDAENCSEFCPKKRSIYFNGGLIEEKPVWRDNCASNSLMAQFGTWLFNRAGWCPGSFAYPDIYDLKNLNTTNTLNTYMEDYTSSGGANYMFSSQMIHVGPLKFNNDVAIEDIVAPNNFKDHSNFNPICSSPIINIINKGKNNLTSCIIKYGMSNNTTYEYLWNGNLKTDEKTTVYLPSLFMSNDTTLEDVFVAQALLPNYADDENEVDNKAQSLTTLPATFDSTFVISFKTNLDAQQTTWKLMNAQDSIVAQSNTASLQANTIHRDTLQLSKGCYRLYIEDSNEDGLDFDWVNNRGVGYLRFIKFGSNQILKRFESDFGKFIDYQFFVGKPEIDTATVVPLSNTNIDLNNLVEIFPNPTKGSFLVNIEMNKPGNATVKVYNALGQNIVNKQYASKATITDSFDISSFENGIYFIKIKVNDVVVHKKLIKQE